MAYYNEHKHDYHTITNFEKEELGWYEKAVRLYNKQHSNSTVYLVKEAYDVNGRRITDFFAVKYSGEDPRTDFWKLFDMVTAKYPEPPVVRKKVKFVKTSGQPWMVTWGEEHRHDSEMQSLHMPEPIVLEKPDKQPLFIDNRKK